jgi:hypothetical protein
MGVLVCGLACAVVLFGGGSGVVLAEAFGLLAVFLGLLLITERATTGRWTRWSHR